MSSQYGSGYTIFRTSMKRFLLNISDAASVPIVFDRSLATPNLRDTRIDKWVVPVYGITRYTDYTIQSELIVNICTRQDPEWDKNIMLLEYYKSSFEKAYFHGSAPIPLLKEGEQIGCINVMNIGIQKGYDFEDQTKVTPMDIMLWCPIAY